MIAISYVRNVGESNSETKMQESALCLISSRQIPTKGQGSWTTRFSRLVNEEPTLFASIICTNTGWSSTLMLGLLKLVSIVVGRFGRPDFVAVIRLWKFRKVILNLFGDNRRVVFCVLDDHKLSLALNRFLKKNGLRDRSKIIFFMHGYDYALDLHKRENFYRALDCLVLMSRSSYNHHINSVHSIEASIYILPAGVEEDRFYRVSEEERQRVRKSLGWREGRKYFAWCSVPRSKKGLIVILNAWQSIVRNRSDVTLIVIGAEGFGEYDGVTFIGPLNNWEIPRYLQASDFFIFSTLCHEGHPLSLTEALRCGSICLASNIDPVAEILADGQFGRLVEIPHDPRSWVNAIAEELEKFESSNGRNSYLGNIPENIYTYSQWKTSLKKIVNSVSESVDI